MIWTFNKPTKVGYYFYRDGMTDHDVVTVDYDLYENLCWWEEWTKSWVPVVCCPDDAEWSDVEIEFPEEPKKEEKCSCGKRYRYKCANESDSGYGKMCLKEYE